MTLAEFISNLADMNDGEDFHRDVLKTLYLAIKNQPLEFESVWVQQMYQSALRNGGAARIWLEGGWPQNIIFILLTWNFFLIFCTHFNWKQK